jgi:hypothetical protein
MTASSWGVPWTRQRGFKYSNPQPVPAKVAKGGEDLHNNGMLQWDVLVSMSFLLTVVLCWRAKSKASDTRKNPCVDDLNDAGNADHTVLKDQFTARALPTERIRG